VNNMKNRKRQNRIRESSLSECSEHSRARELDFAIQNTRDKAARCKRRENTPGLVLPLAQSQPFIPWALHAVERAFSRVLQSEIQHYGNQSES
jgi:hypothetical protein